ncbi:flavin-containing monooxygenase [Nocardia inohanensis]|uniref:flavin-containing monooxygenase n=1 Tax=Nocardia inohanensis TaxID=209246 RepID=UPI00082AE922|nr:NAD(P)/FAD-dependent oxidoreductase [Nocardia inohanensis]
MTRRSTPTSTTDVDVLIIGAGISGISAAYHLATRRAGTSFAVLEARDSVGGTWSLFRYPGIRSDSDMPTYGFGFKPWTHRRSIAEGHLILDYLRDTVTENSLAEHIRLGHRVLEARFSTATGRWSVLAERTGGKRTRFSARFLYLGTGIYDHRAGYTPDFAGRDEFEGTIVHPQHWPQDLDHTGKRVVVIGSGATAVTLIPAMAGSAAHVTMLQRSPSYVFSLPAEDAIANALNAALGHDRAAPLIRRKNIALTRGIYKACKRFPRLTRRVLIGLVKRQLPAHFDVDTHFTPRYNPWDQRLCMVPGGDLFKTLSTGRASVVTDRIARFTPSGIELESGQHLTADIIVTATGFTMSPLGRIRLEVDGREIDPAATTVYKSMMLSEVPNLAFVVGYTNISWTLKADLVSEHFCRLLDYMDANGFQTVTPVAADPEMPRVPLVGDLESGYVQRGITGFPRAGSTGPWSVEMAYELDARRLREGPVSDPALRFDPATSTSSVTSALATATGGRR